MAMTKPKILVTRKIPQTFIDQLETIGEVKMWDKTYEAMLRDQFLEEVKDAAACFITLSEQIDEEVYETATQLKVVANMAVGYDNIEAVLSDNEPLTPVK
ncbi:lactate dehydrogenase-like 2-hydroxyacid dehydrogenase [Staphylococcus auricularis]